MTKRPLILLSGGLDSTTLLQRALSEGPADVLYGEAGQHPQKTKNERLARRQIIDHYNQVMPYKVWNEYEPNQRVSMNGTASGTWGQMVPWLVYALQAVNPEIHSEVQMGFVMGDSNSLVFQDLIQAWNNLWKISKKGDVVPLVIPLQTYVKYALLNELDPRVYPLIWVCEQPTSDKACKSCTPCLTHQHALNVFKQHHGQTLQKTNRERLKTFNNRRLNEEPVIIDSLSQFRCTNLIRTNIDTCKWETL